MTNIVCDCGGWNWTESDAHDINCAIWMDNDVCNGSAYWDGDQAKIIYDAEDLDDIECIDIACTVPKPHTYATCQAEDIDDDIIDLVHDPDDLLTVVLTAMHGKRPSDEMYNECAEYIGVDILKIFERLSNRRPIELVDVDAIEKWGAQLHILTKEEVPPLYDCICQATGHAYCGACGVVRCNDLDGPWVPDYARRQQEVEMFLTGQMYVCKCDSKKMYACRVCKIQRWDTKVGWTYWNEAGTGDHQYKGKKPAANKSSSVTPTWNTGGHGMTTTYYKCRHYGETVLMPDGTPIMCSSEHRRKADEPVPDFGCYMYSGWEPDWLAYWLNWTDYGLPKMSLKTVDKIVDDLLLRARAGQVVEIGCMGGHGRTGTLLAMIALKAGAESADAAMEWVWGKYCKEAIEGTTQEWYVSVYEAVLKDLPIPERPIPPCTYYQHKTKFEKGEPCDKHCSSEDEDFLKWCAEVQEKKEKAEADKEKEQAKKAAQNLMPTLGGIAKSIGKEISKQVNKQTSTKISSKTGGKFVSLSDPIDWKTPVPPYDDLNNTWCSTWRHLVLWWRGETCQINGRECQYWRADLRQFEKTGRQRAPIVESVANEDGKRTPAQVAKCAEILGDLRAKNPAPQTIIKADAKIGQVIDLTTGEVIETEALTAKEQQSTPVG